MRYVLAIDPGGSKCEAVLVREDGCVSGWGRFMEPGISGRSAQAIMTAVDAALQGLAPDAEVQLVSLGPDTEFTPRIPSRLLELPFRVEPRAFSVTEQGAALCLAGHESGIVALAGTGAFVYGRTNDGRERKLDGAGPVLGDIGSASYIGHQAMRAVIKATWHPRHATSLREPIVAQSQQISKLRDFVTFSLTPMDRSVVASFAKIVDDEAERGDGVAIRLLQQAAEAMAENVRDLVDVLGMAAEPYVMVGTGSVATRSRTFWNHLSRCVAQFAPKLEPRVYPWPPALGVALHGLGRVRGLKGEEIHALATAVRFSYQAFLQRPVG
jgi:N-acetylglucosamine kinase-like BadF-type ATPase